LLNNAIEPELGKAILDSAINETIRDN